MEGALAVLAAARALAERLHPDTIWAVTITQDTDSTLPAAFNIYIQSEAEWDELTRLFLHVTPSWQNATEFIQIDNFYPGLTLSLIKESTNV